MHSTDFISKRFTRAKREYCEIDFYALDWFLLDKVHVGIIINNLNKITSEIINMIRTYLKPL